MSEHPQPKNFTSDASYFQACWDWERKENAKLREELEKAEKLSTEALGALGEVRNGAASRYAMLWNEKDKWKERAEAAEAKLKALDEQEPVNYLKVTGRLASMPRGDGTRLIGFVVDSSKDGPFGAVSAALELLLGKLYAAPVPPVDVQEQIAKAREEGVPKCECGTCQTEGALIYRLYNEAPNYKDIVAAGAQIQHLRSLIAASQKPREEP